MKKFFALMLVVAMLSVAGSAMAANPTISASETSFTLKAGGASKTITVTTAAGNTGGTLGALKVSGGGTWVTVSGNSVTFAPTSSVAAGTYTVGISVTETYSASPAAGHGSAPMTASAVVPIQVSVLSASATGTQVVVKVTEIVTTITKSVTIISASARESAVVQTFEQVTRTVTETITTTVLTKVKGFTQALAEAWATKAAAVETAKKAVVDAVATDPARKAAVFPRLSATADVTPRENNLLQPATSSVSSDATPEQKLAAATAALSGNNKKALSAGEAVRPSEAGTYTFPKTFGSDLYGTRIGGSRNKQARARVKASFSAAAAADDEEGVAFLNSAGTVVNTIPGAESPDEIMPGFVNMLVVMEANEVYEPVVFATTADLAANSIDLDARSVDVTVVDAVVEEEKEVVVDVNSDGSVSDETVVEKADTTVESAMATAMGASSITMVPASSYGAKISSSALAVEDALAASQDLHVAARIGRPLNNLGTGAYYYEISFDALPSGRTLLLGTSFVFYPDGIEAGSEAYLKVFDKSGNEVTNPANILGQTGIVAFEINSDSGIRTSNFDNTLENPTVTLKMAESGSGGHETKVYSDDVLQGLYEKNYINANGELQAAAYSSGSKPAFRESGDIYVLNIALKSDFTVDADKWSATCGNEVLTVAAITGTIKNRTTTSATVQIDKTTLPSGNSDVVVKMHPTGAEADNNVSASWRVSRTSPTGDTGVGSSSGGCSAGSAVLALAVLGAFIKSRKK